MTTPIAWFLKNLPQGRPQKSNPAKSFGALKALTLAAGLAVAVAGLQPALALGPEDGRMRDDLLRPQMLRELNLSADQKKKFREYRAAHEKQRIQLRSEKAVAELDLMNLTQTFPVHKVDLLKQGEKIAAIEAQIGQMRLEALGFFLENLTADQHRKFVELHESLREKRQQRFERFREKMRVDDEREDGEGEGPER